MSRHGREFTWQASVIRRSTFPTPPEHDELRAVLRDICETEIASYAAEVDGQARFRKKR